MTKLWNRIFLNDEIQPSTDAALTQAIDLAEQQIYDFIQHTSPEQLFSLFNGGQTTPTNDWLANAESLRHSILDGSYNVDVNLLDSTDIQGALGAFITSTKDGKPLIVLNKLWLENGASNQKLSEVLLEEFGHSLDTRLNNYNDTFGDEGARFAAVVLGQDDSAPILAEDDHILIKLEGQSISAEASGSVFDVAQNQLSFINATEITPTSIGAATADYTVGTAYLYTNVVNVGGQQIDAIVTLSAATNVSTSGFDFDSTANPYPNATKYFQPNVTWSNAGGSISFTFKFILSGSGLTSANYNPSTNAGTSVTLRNVLVNTYDLDGSGSNSSGRQYTDLSGISGYTLSNPTNVTVSTPSTGVTRFQTTVGGNITDAPGTTAGDKIRAQASFAEVSQTTITLGDTGASGLAYFGLDFSSGTTSAGGAIPFTAARDTNITIAGGPVTTSEAGTTDTFTVVLNAAPTSNVTVTLSGLDATEGSLSTTTLTFTSANWNTPQTVTVTGVDDALVDGDITYTLTATSSVTVGGDTSYSGRTAVVDVINSDNDFPTLIYSGSTYTEATANDGSISTSITITLSGDTYATDVVSANKIVASNVPTGLTASFVRTSATVITATLTGNASAHANANDISNLTFTFQNGAFTNTATASNVTNYNKSDLVVDFADLASVTVSSPTVNEASPYAVFTVSGVTGQTITLALANATGAQGGGTDYGSATATTNLQYSLDGGSTWLDYSTTGAPTLTSSSMLVRTPIVEDSIQDNNETFTLTATPNGGSAVVGTATINDQGSGDIFNSNGTTNNSAVKSDDRVITVTSPTVNEASPYAVFTVSGVTGQTITLALANATGAQGGGTDYGSATATTNLQYSLDGGSNWLDYSTTGAPTLTSSSMLVRTPIVEDSIFEYDETFTLTATPLGGYAVVGTTTIIDNDLAPGLSINDITVNEGAGTATFTVTRSGATGATASVSYASSDGTATAGSDYSATSGTLNFGIGETSKTFTVAILNDSIFENSENFDISLSNPIGASITDGNGQAIIKDDGTGSGGTDDDRTISVSSPTVNEASPYVFFTVDGETGQSVTLSLSDGTAGNADYGSSLEFSIDGGSSWSSYSGDSVSLNGPDGTLLVRTAIKQDFTFENSEDFFLNARASSGSIVTGTATIKDDGTGTIFNANGSENLKLKKDDDRSLAVEDVTVNEGSPYAVFRVSGVEGQQLQLSLEDNGSDFAPLQGNAQIGVDTGNQLQYFNGKQWANYTAGSKITYPKGSTTLLMRVALVNDNLFEKQESFKLKAVAGDLSAYGTGIISDDGQGPIFNESGSENPTATRDDDRVLRINSFDVNEGSEYAVFTVTATPNSQLGLALVSTGSGASHAALGIDTGSQLQFLQQGAWQNYSPGSKVSVGDGQLFVRVAIVNDTDKEGPETFRLLASESTLGSTFGTATIKDEGTGSVWLGNNTQPASASELSAAKFILDDDFDLDGVPPNVEEILATMSASTGNGGEDGDLNNDGEQDAQQNSVATLAWIKEENFQKALEGTLTEVKPIISVEVKSTQTPDTAGDSQFQLSNIQVVQQASSEFGGKAIDQTLTSKGETIQAPWDPIQFMVTPVDTDDDKKLDDADPTRDGTQIKIAIDIERAGMNEGDFNAYYKYVSDDALKAANGSLRDLNGTAITAAGWYDFTQHQDANGQYTGDGARYLIKNGKITGIELTLTDNAFGDNDPTTDSIFDPGMPVKLAVKKAAVIVHSLKNIAMNDSIDDVVLDNKSGGSNSDQSCLPAFLRASSVSGKHQSYANLNATGNSKDNNMVGNDGNNTLSGLDGNDALFGQNGNDILIGGAGSDELTGGTGKDIFRYLKLSDSTPDKRDTILDFTSGEDKIDLRKLDANSNISGDQAFLFINQQAFSNQAGELRFAEGILQGDTNGDGSADFEIILNGVNNLLEADKRT